MIRSILMAMVSSVLFVAGANAQATSIADARNGGSAFAMNVTSGPGNTLAQATSYGGRAEAFMNASAAPGGYVVGSATSHTVNGFAGSNAELHAGPGAQVEGHALSQSHYGDSDARILGTGVGDAHVYVEGTAIARPGSRSMAYGESRGVGVYGGRTMVSSQAIADGYYPGTMVRATSIAYGEATHGGFSRVEAGAVSQGYMPAHATAQGYATYGGNGHARATHYNGR